MYPALDGLDRVLICAIFQHFQLNISINKAPFAISVRILSNTNLIQC